MALPGGTMRLAELAFNFMALDEQLVALGERRATHAGKTVSCAKGCGACCRQAVPVSPPEAWMIADLIAMLPPERQKEVRERFEGAAQWLSVHGLVEALMQTPASDAEAQALAARYFAVGLACPFLEDVACSIHPWRPSACREYLVVSPAAWCGEPFARPVERVEVAVHLSQALARLTGELLGREPQLIPLALAPAWAEAHRADGQRRWDAADLVRRLLQRMSEK
jgi:Fe-S-cluster containining protein